MVAAETGSFSVLAPLSAAGGPKGVERAAWRARIACIGSGGSLCPAASADAGCRPAAPGDVAEVSARVSLGARPSCGPEARTWCGPARGQSRGSCGGPGKSEETPWVHTHTHLSLKLAIAKCAPCVFCDGCPLQARTSSLGAFVRRWQDASSMRCSGTPGLWLHFERLV